MFSSWNINYGLRQNRVKKSSYWFHVGCWKEWSSGYRIMLRVNVLIVIVWYFFSHFAPKLNAPCNLFFEVPCSWRAFEIESIDFIAEGYSCSSEGLRSYFGKNRLRSFSAEMRSQRIWVGEFDIVWAFHKISRNNFADRLQITWDGNWNQKFYRAMALLECNFSICYFQIAVDSFVPFEALHLDRSDHFLMMIVIHCLLLYILVGKSGNQLCEK